MADILKVVLVDDSAAVRRSLGHLLASEPRVAIVGHAEDVREAVQVIEAVRPDIVVLDVDLRHGDRGIDVLRHVTREHPAIQVVVLSNFTWASMREGFLAAGAKAYFDKSDEFLAARDWIAARAHEAGKPPGS